MYVYVSKRGHIILRSRKRILSLPDCQEYITNYNPTDRLIFEDNEVKLYESSRQYGEDTNKYHTEKEIKELKKKNQELEEIANSIVTEDLELEVKGEEADEYHRQLYLLKNKRGLSQ